jgi:tetratricopeptide (TPR) repeat protein
MLLGENSAAIQSLERAMRLSPIPNSIRFGILGTALRNAGRFEEAVGVLQECLRRFPDFVHAHTSLAVAYGMMGDQAAAEREVGATLKATPNYTVQRFVNPDLYRSREVMQRCAEVLRSAGMPGG